MYVSSFSRIKTPSARPGFQQPRQRESRPLAIRSAMLQLELDARLEAELNPEAHYRHNSMPPQRSSLR